MEDKSNILETAKKEQANGNYALALNLIESILDIDDFDISFEYGKILYFLHRFDDTIAFFINVNQKFPNNKNVLDILLKSYKESNRIDDLLQFLNTQSGNIDTNFILDIAEIFFNEKRYDESIKFYQHYIDLNDNDIVVASKLIQIYNFLGMKDKVIKICNKYLQDNIVKGDKFFFNLFLNELEIAQGKIQLKSNPRSMLVMLTNKCNLKCPMCATVHQSNHWEISDKFRQYIIDNLLNLELITWQGGEVFLYKGFEELFIEAGKNKYLKQIIITNALLIDDKWANLLSLANHLDLTISIDSIEKEIYEKLRFGAKFEQLLINLNNIKLSRQKNNSNITLTMRTTVSDENIYTLEKIVDFAIEYKFNILIWSPLVMDGQNSRKYDFNDKSQEMLSKIKNIRQKALQKAIENNIKVLDWLPNIDLFTKTVSPTDIEQKCLDDSNDKKIEKVDDSSSCSNIEIPLCFRPWKQLATTVDGELKPECMCLKDVENLHKCDDYNGIWNNIQMQEYRKRLIGFNQEWCCDSCVNNIVSQEHKKFTCW